MTSDRPSPDPLDAFIGRRLRLRREILRLSQEQIASAAGVTYQQIQRYEQGSNSISASRLFDLCQILGVGLNYPFQGLDDGSDWAGPGGVPNGADGRGGVDPAHLTRTETLDLLRCFWRIPSSSARQELLNLVKALEGGKCDPAP